MLPVSMEVVMYKRADQLSGEDMGKTITIARDNTHITGTLAGITHTADLVADERLCAAVPEIMAGRIEYGITIGTMHLTVNGDERVHVDA